jgi:hypothetical protein
LRAPEPSEGIPKIERADFEKLSVKSIINLLVSGMPIRKTSFRLPEISDDVLFEHLKSKANPIRLVRNWKPWTDEDIKYMIRTYGANLTLINKFFTYTESPIG